jgi:hypothetical protein
VAPEGEGFRSVTLALKLPTREEVDATLAESEAAGATVTRPARVAGHRAPRRGPHGRHRRADVLRRRRSDAPAAE